MSHQWAPPPDPERPNCPYLTGFQVEIRSHHPPAPFGPRPYPPGPHPIMPTERLKSVTQTKHVLSHPPLETTGNQTTEPDVAHLTITKPLHIGNARGAQLVVCSVARKTNDAEPFMAVAKIYDPLYYPFSDKLVSAPVDVVRMADSDYSREAAAYELLRTADQTGLFAPQYYGSWTFTLPLCRAMVPRQRLIRLVLIEYLDGSAMKELYVRNSSGPNAEPDAFHYDEEYRLNVLARVLDGVVRQRHAGLDQRDVAPRNIILVPPPYEPRKAQPRVVLVDYNNSVVFEESSYRNFIKRTSELPQNPMERYWDESLPEFVGWTPWAWYDNPRLRQEWLLSCFGGDRQSLYAPLDHVLEFRSLEED